LIEGRDSAYAPNAVQLAAFFAQGVRVFGGYIKLGNDGVLNGWSQSDFARVRAAGMTPIGFFSGFDDPATVKALAASWGILAALDDESGMRPDGSWVQAELTASGGGLYGNGWVHNGRAAAFDILSGYPTSGDPSGVSWNTAYAPRPAGPCGWQWAGSHVENGITVDSSWLDDWFAGLHGGGSGSITAPVLRRTRTIATSDSYIMFGIGDDDALYCDRFDMVKGAWTGATKLGGAISEFDISGAGQRIDIYARGLTDRQAYHLHSSDAGVTFSAFELLGGTYKAPLVALGPGQPAGTAVDLTPALNAIGAVKSELDVVGGDLATVKRLVEKDLAP